MSTTTEPPAWDGYLKQHAAATLFHDPRWGAVLRKAYRCRPFYLTATRGGRAAGVLPLVLQKSLLWGTHLGSLPYFDSAGVVADDPQATAALVAAARGLMLELGVAWVELRQSVPLGAGLPSRTDKVTLRLALPADPDQLWKNLDAKVCNQVRKAERESLTTHSGGVELLDEFYAVYSRTMRDLGSPPHSRRFFALVAAHFPEEARFYVVRSGAAPLAASLTLRDGATVRVPWAGSDWRFRSLWANMLLYWTMLSDSCARKADCFDFGRSTVDSGTYKFKTQWGASPVQLHWHYLLPEGGRMPEVRPDNPKYRLMIACWQRLPLAIVRLVGPRIIAKLS